MRAKNTGRPDKIVRLAIAAVILYLFLSGRISGIPAAAALTISGLLLITVFTGYSPLYGFFGINTRKNLNDKAYSYYRKSRSWLSKKIL